MIEYAFRQLRKREKIYPTLDLELGAVVVMLQIWKVLSGLHEERGMYRILGVFSVSEFRMIRV